MALVDAPFFGFGATKSIGKVITFAKWKGKNYARQRVVPANPQTADQTTERNHFSDLVDDWHNAKLNENDKKGWNLRAQMEGRPMSGFNKFIEVGRGFGSGNANTLIYGFVMEDAAPYVLPKITCDTAGNCTLKIIRGPGAGYSETKVMVADVEEEFTMIDVNANDIVTFEFTTAGKLGGFGFIRAVVGGF
mgnify:CR=1 FL=1|jgi:hypothetical protein